MSFEPHPDFIVQPYLNGIRLVKPAKASNVFPSIGSLFDMPLIVFFVDFEARFIDGNHFTCLTNVPDSEGYCSHKGLKNMPFSKLFKKDSIEMFTCHNNHILSTKRLTVYEELCVRLDEIAFSSISFKFPVFDPNDRILGILGISTLTQASLFKEAESLSDSMERIFQTRLVPHYRNLLPGFCLNEKYLTKQEISCLRLLVSGKTIKSISQHLKLSSRTVEHYLENIKDKLNVTSKSELIEKVVQQLWPEMFL